VRAVTPAGSRFRYAFDGAGLIAYAPPERAPYCVRRATLDPWLQDAAEEAGAQLRFRQRVVELLKQGERVTGVVVRTPNGLEQLHADLVVGADGERSTIAQLTAAPEYLVHEGTRGGYFTYYSAPRDWAFDWDIALEHVGQNLHYVFRCDGGQVLLAFFGVKGEVARWGSAHRERFEAALKDCPTTRRLSEGLRPQAPLMGRLDARFYYRKPIGPGFALVGDAGHFKDVVTGQGMADAFLDAERLATAICDGRDLAFQHYWRDRDVATLPHHFDAIAQGRVGFNEPFMRWVIARLGLRPEQRDRIMLMVQRKIDPTEVVPTATLLSALASALAHGRWDVLRGFVGRARELAGDARVLAERKRLLHAVRAELEHERPRAATGARGTAHDVTSPESAV